VLFFFVAAFFLAVARLVVLFLVALCRVAIVLSKSTNNVLACEYSPLYLKY
jgi:hypothetical protein